MSKKNRIQEAFNYLKYKGLTTSQKDLSEKMGANRVSVSRALNGDESYLTDDFIERLNTTFNSIFSSSWLLTGEGSMLREGAPITPALTEEGGEILTDANSLKHYYELDVTASNMEDLSDNEHGQPFRRLLIPGYEGCVAFNVMGESMLPTARPNDLAAIDPKPIDIIVNGEIYLVVTRDGQRMVKRLMVIPSDEEGGVSKIRCFSDNKEQTWYAPFDISSAMIHYVYRVKGFISLLNLA